MPYLKLKNGKKINLSEGITPDEAYSFLQKKGYSDEDLGISSTPKFEKDNAPKEESNLLDFASPQNAMMKNNGSDFGQSASTGTLLNAKDTAEPFAAALQTPNPQGYFSPYAPNEPYGEMNSKQISELYNKPLDKLTGMNLDPSRITGQKEQSFNENPVQNMFRFGGAAAAGTKLLVDLAEHAPKLLAKYLSKMSAKGLPFGEQPTAIFGKQPEAQIGGFDQQQPIQYPRQNPGNSEIQGGTTQISEIPQAHFANTESQFQNKPFQTPEHLQPQEIPNLSESMAKNLSQKLTEGKTLQEHGKEFAKHAKGTYEGIEEEAKKPYEKMWNDKRIKGEEFDSPEYEATFAEPEQTKSTYKPFKEKVAKGEVHKTPANKSAEPDYPKGSQLRKAYDDFKESKSLQDQHGLKTQLGYRKGQLDRIERTRGLTDQERKEYIEVNKQYGAISRDIDNNIAKRAPELKGEYAAAGQNWLQKVYPWRVDRDLNDIVTGRVTNPEISKIKGIVKNPEPSMEGVLNELGDKGKNMITRLSMGLLPHEASPEQFAKALDRLQKSGHESIITPELNQHVVAIKNQQEVEKTAQATENIKRSIANELEKVHKTVNEPTKPFVKFNPEKEANAVIDHFSTQIEKEQDKLFKAYKESQDALHAYRKKNTASREKAVKEANKTYEETQQRIKLLQKTLQEAQLGTGAFAKKSIGAIAGDIIGHKIAGTPGGLIGGYIGKKLM